MILWKERVLAASVPVVTLLLGALSSFLGFWCPLICYIIFRRANKPFAATHAMRYFDICITALVYTAAMMVVLFALGIVAKDSGGEFALFPNDYLAYVIASGIRIYLLLALLLYVICPLRGKDFRMPFAVRLFEALVRYRSRNLSQPTADAVTD